MNLIKTVKVKELFSGYNPGKVLWLLGFFVFFGCYEEELCDDLIDNPLRITFYTFENNADGEPVPAIIDSLTVIGLGKTDSYANNYEVGLIEIPLDPSKDDTGFLLIFPESIDTVNIHYERDLSLVSMDCGFITFSEITEVKTTNNNIDYFDIKQRNVTNIDEEHIHCILHSEFD